LGIARRQARKLFDELLGSEDRAMLIVLTQLPARPSQAGHARPRKALHLPALTAIRFNPLLGGLFERLVAAGKTRTAAAGACMRKLLMIAYGVLRNRAPLDPSWRRKRPS
jgi:hypothetical protein